MGDSAVATRRAESAFGVADVAGPSCGVRPTPGPVTAGGQRTEPLPTTFCIAGTAGGTGRGRRISLVHETVPDRRLDDDGIEWRETVLNWTCTGAQSRRFSPGGRWPS